MFYQDKKGKILNQNEIYRLPPDEIERRGIHVYEENYA